MTPYPCYYFNPDHSNIENAVIDYYPAAYFHKSELTLRN